MLILFALFLVSVVQCVPQPPNKHYSHLNAHPQNSISSFQELLNLERGHNAGFQVDGYSPRFRRCANHHVEIPFFISDDFSKKSRETILKSLAHFSNETCLKFREYKDDDNAAELNFGVFFSPSVEKATCESFHYVNATQHLSVILISLNEPFCFNGTGRINRVLYLSLGFVSETVRLDRDNYVTVLWDNIEPDWKFKFETRESLIFISELPYDYLSVSHYYPNDYAKEGKLTLITKSKNQPLQWNSDLSALDKHKINTLICGIHDDESDESTSTDIYEDYPDYRV